MPKIKYLPGSLEYFLGFNETMSNQGKELEGMFV
jgi:hypothetical protein